MAQIELLRVVSGTSSRVPLDRRIRLLGVRVGALVKPEGSAHLEDGQRVLL